MNSYLRVDISSFPDKKCFTFSQPFLIDRVIQASNFDPKTRKIATNNTPTVYPLLNKDENGPSLTSVNGLGEDIYNLLSRINGIDNDSSITNKSSEMMVLDGNVFCPGSTLWALCNCDAAFIVVPDSTTEYWISC